MRRVPDERADRQPARPCRGVVIASGYAGRATTGRRGPMLGDKIGEESGQVIGTRVLASDTGPKLETTFQMQANLLGVEGTDIGTYWSVLRPDGTLYGEGNGVVMTAE